MLSAVVEGMPLVVEAEDPVIFKSAVGGGALSIPFGAVGLLRAGAGEFLSAQLNCLLLRRAKISCSKAAIQSSELSVRLEIG